jgi:5-methylcytosine-specific restriction endonuclease McrA
MPNRRLSSEALTRANALLKSIRVRLRKLAGDDEDLHFAYRRKVYKELVYDERDKPMVRRRLKALKRIEQGGICPMCKKPLPAAYCVRDLFVAAAGHTTENAQLICQECDVTTQASRGYA